MALDGIYAYTNEEIETFYPLFKHECQQPSIGYSIFNSPERKEFLKKHREMSEQYKHFCQAAENTYPGLKETPPVIPTLEEMKKDLGYAKSRSCCAMM